MAASSGAFPVWRRTARIRLTKSKKRDAVRPCRTRCCGRTRRSSAACGYRTRSLTGTRRISGGWSGARQPLGCGFREGYVAINFDQRHPRRHAGKLEHSVQAGEFGHEPRMIGLSDMALDERPVLRDEDVLLQ